MRNGKEFMSHLDGLLKEVRITRAQLLRDIGSSMSLFNMCEKRGNLPPAEAVFNISKRMNVSMESLLEDVSESLPSDIMRMESMLLQIPPEPRKDLEAYITYQYEKELKKKDGNEKVG